MNHFRLKTSSLFNLITQMTTHEHESSLLALEIREAQKEIQQTTRITLSWP
jgi:hypothetical protein